MATIQLNDSFNQKAVSVKPDDIIELQLEESATTGYRWEITGINNSELKVMTSDYSQDKNAGVGAGGIIKITLKVIKPGGQLKLENKRSWSGDVYKTFEVSFA